jgi:hypothetical protein
VVNVGNILQDGKVRDLFFTIEHTEIIENIFIAVSFRCSFSTHSDKIPAFLE